MEIQEHVSLASLTYYKIGGPAKYFAKPKSVEDLKTLSKFIHKNKLSYFILGAGSNVLFHDDGFDGLILHTGSLDQKLEVGESTLTVGTSTLVIQLLRVCMKNGISGFERLVGIPGSLGGVFYMNAGTHRGEIKDLLQSIHLYNLKTCQHRTVQKSEMKYSYRTQHFIDAHEIILSGVLSATPSDPKSVQTDINKLVANRRKTQPIDKPSCGSVFKNPDPEKKIFSWKLLDEVGLRGHRIGNAQISELHTNFIVNLGNAQSSDVRSLIELAQQRVFEKFNIRLIPEVQILPTQLPKNRF